MDIVTALLICALVAALWGLIRLYRKHLILRHLFIEYSDWCADKIDAMTGSAVFKIVELQQELVESAGYEPITTEEARGAVPFAILEAKPEWQKKIGQLQARLARNGMKPLDLVDLDGPMLNPVFTGIKW